MGKRDLERESQRERARAMCGDSNRLSREKKSAFVCCISIDGGGSRAAFLDSSDNDVEWKRPHD